MTLRTSKIIIGLVCLLLSVMAATALEVKKEVIFETYNGINEFQFFEDENTLTEIKVDSQNLTLNQNLRYAIHTGLTPVNFKIVDIVFPYDIIDTSHQEKFHSMDAVTFINPTYADYFIIAPQGDNYLSVTSKPIGTMPLDKMKMVTLIILGTTIITTLVLLVRRKQRKKKEQNPEL